MNKRPIVLLTYLFLIPYIQGLAQTPTGTITGQVENATTFERIAGANVSVVGTTLGASADPDGEFLIANIPVGTYQLRASSVGFTPAVIADIVVAAGRPMNVVIRLQESSVGLEEVEVRASYFQKTPDAPVSVQRLSYEEIRRSPGGFEDVVRTIAVLPGVAQAAPGRNDLVVRGGAPSENLFVVDNIEIPNINHFGTQGASGGPLSYINLDFVRETAFSTGAFGVRYGDRMSSVLTIELQDGRRDRLGGKGTISASQFGLNLNGPLGQDASFIFSARRSYLDFIFKAAGFSFVPEYWDFLGRVAYRLDRSNTLTFLAVGAIDDVSFFNDDADNRFDNSRVLGTAQRQYASGGSWRRVFPGGFSTVTLGRSYVNYNGIQRDSLLNPIFANRSKEGETSLRADVVLQPSSTTELSVGAQARRVTFDGSIALPSYSTPFGDSLGVDIQDVTATGFKGAAYAQVSQRFFSAVRFTLGGRLDHFSLIREKNYFSPRASLEFDLSPSTTLSASGGTYRQNPSYIWLAANETNRTLRAARADQYILGVEHLLYADLKMRLEAFTKRYREYPASLDRRYLVLANTGSGFGGSDENFASFGLDNLVGAGTGRSLGVEFLVQKKLSETPLYGLMSVSVTETKFTALDGVERPGAFDQRMIVNLTGGYRFNERWEASMKFRFATGQPYTPFNAGGTQDVAAYNSLRAKSVHSLDLRVQRQLHRHSPLNRGKRGILTTSRWNVP